MATKAPPTEDEIRAWYNRRYVSRGALSMRPYDTYLPFLDYLDVQARKHLLDVSCGTGFLLLAAAGRGLVTSGVDISDEAVKIAREVSPNSTVEVAKAEELPFDDQVFDYVTCLGSIEHFLDADQSLEEMKRVAKPGAKLCIMVPNSRFVLWPLLGRAGTEQQGINELLLSDSEWTALFRKHGLKVLAIHPDRWLLHWRRAASGGRLARSLVTLLNRLAATAIPLAYTYQFVFILDSAVAPRRPSDHPPITATARGSQT